VPLGHMDSRITESNRDLPSDSEIRGVVVLRARKPGRVFWQKRKNDAMSEHMIYFANV